MKQNPYAASSGNTAVPDNGVANLRPVRIVFISQMFCVAATVLVTLHKRNVLSWTLLDAWPQVATHAFSTISVLLILSLFCCPQLVQLAIWGLPRFSRGRKTKILLASIALTGLQITTLFMGASN